MDKPIENLDTYLSRMRRSMYDKMFFVDSVEPTEFFIDFGCADGDMMNHLFHFYPNSTLIGVEENLQFSSQVKFEAVRTLREAFEITDRNGTSDTTLILSSALHELYHYKPNEVNAFWDLILEYHPKNIVIRDMFYNPTNWYGESNPEASRAIRCYYNNTHRYLTSSYEHLERWEELWGPLTIQKSLVHLLLTYKYTDNWEREFAENYFCDWKTDIAKRFIQEYYLAYSVDFTPKYLDNLINKDFGLKPNQWRGQDTTHSKVILKLL